jgi:uncharacterized membrane protein
MSVQKREIIHILGRHSDLSAETLGQLLQRYVYRQPADWYRFVRWCLLALGAGFLVSGITFFFAYNWNDLHKFLKIGIMAALVILVTLPVVFSSWPDMVKKILLTAASVLAGVLFAVFGQVYQTGADAFDFFLGWMVFITLWVIVSDFPPLWLGYLALLNLNITSYADQVARGWTPLMVLTILTIFNGSVAIAGHHFRSKSRDIRVPDWLLSVIVLAAAGFATSGVILGIFGGYDHAFPVLLAFIAVVYPLAVDYGLRRRRIFYLAVIALSSLVMFCSLILKFNSGQMMFLFLSFFIIISVTLLISFFLKLQRDWDHEKK